MRKNTTVTITNLAGGDARTWSLRPGRPIPGSAYEYNRRIDSGVFGGSLVDIDGPNASARQTEWDQQLADNAHAREQDGD
jgi:hypothetical protein